MKFEALSIKEAIGNIESGKMFLPPIQRNFVWDYSRIVNLFDSLYRNYPIGNCIFWKLTPETSQNYPLYKFIKEYSENKTNKHESAPRNLLEQDVYAVVDGQQRLSSLYIGLAGIYRYKKSGKGLQNIDANFVSSKLYVNLLATESKSKDEEDLFDFLGEEDAAFVNDRNLWFEVGKLLTWENSNQTEQLVNEILYKKVIESKKKTSIARFETRKEKIVSMLKALYEMLNDNRIYYFDIDNQNLDEVVDIFTRVNSGGMTLKKSDLLFSILVAQWNEGRDEIKEIIESMIESDINISQDFIMRACLVLSDLPVKYKLESFTSKNINIIKKNWNDIKSSLIILCEILPEIGYKNLPNLSDNALIPIAYYIKKGGNYKTIKAKKNLQQYYVVSQVNGIFGGQGDQVLEKIRTEIKKQLKKDNTLNYQNFRDLKLPGSKTFELNLEELVENVSYYSPHAYFLLSLIYPTVDFKVRRYEVDHIHPRSKFNSANLKSIGIEDDETIENWMDEKRDLLPNLQLLAFRDNTSKKAKTIIDYLKDKPLRERREFMKENLIPADWKMLELKNFDDFFKYRKKQLVNKLKKQFAI
jgi:uncharacterized protein with ParB-like and HNH nuclease domain